MKRTLLYFFVLLPVLLAVTAWMSPWPRSAFFGTSEMDEEQIQASVKFQDPDSGQTIKPDENARRLVFLLQYISNDYAEAVQQGKIVNASEYQEIRDFAKALVQQYEKSEIAKEQTRVRLQGFEKLISEKAESEKVRKASIQLVREITQQSNLLPFPLATPDLANGKKLFRSACVSCHGELGNGRGPSARLLNPKPRDFTDSKRMNFLAPYQLYQAITFGVNGTAMPPFSQPFTAAQRWDLAFYLMTLRQDFQPARQKPDEKFNLQELATLANSEIAAKLRARTVPNHDSVQGEIQGMIDYYRQNLPQLTLTEHLAITENLLRQSFTAYLHGRPGTARKLALDSYLQGFEAIETSIESSLKIEFENIFSKYRWQLNTDQSKEKAREYFDSLSSILDKIRSTPALSGLRTAEKNGDVAKGFYFFQSLTILLREGIEAALLIALLFAFTAAAKQNWLKSYITTGATGGLVAGGLTWLAARYLIDISTLGREALEGITSLLAALVLLTVCLWIIHNVDVQRWKNLIRRQAEKALGARGPWTLAFTAFLAVYREAFESVLFYQALWLRANSNHSAIVIGFLLGAVILTVLWLLMQRFGARLPIKPFFAVTSLMLALLTFTFAGYGVRELQEIGWISETILPWNLQLPLLGIYPTLEGSALQLGIILSLILGYAAVQYENHSIRMRSTEAKFSQG